MPLTYANIKADCADVVNMNAADARVLALVNRAQRRLLYHGKYKDTLSKYVVCMNSGCITWPRQLETIEVAAICSAPLVIRNSWYEFLGTGPGILDSTSGPYLTMTLSGQTFVAFDDVTGTGKKLAIYADGTEKAGSTILVRYYDSNANKVYTTYNGQVIEGERIVIPAAGNYAYSASQVMPFGLYHVSKPTTNYPIRLYAYDTVALTYLALAYYEPDETLPEYRRSLIPCFSGQSSGTCESTRITVIGKSRFIAAVDDNSVLMVSHPDAIVLGVQAVHKENNNLITEAKTYWTEAFQCLDDELHHFNGDGAAAPLRIVGAEVYGGGIANLV